MSLIEYKRYVLTTGECDFLDSPLVFGFSERSHSMITTNSGRTRLKHINLRLIERDPFFMKEMIRCSVACEDGSLKMNGKEVKPESFIAAWRRSYETAISLQSYLMNANLQFEMHSVVDQLTTIRDKLDSTQDAYNERLDQLQALLNTVTQHDSIMDGINDPEGLATPVTQFTLTPENLEEMLGILSRLLSMGVSGRSMVKSSFSLYAWRRGVSNDDSQHK